MHFYVASNRPPAASQSSSTFACVGDAAFVVDDHGVLMIRLPKERRQMNQNLTHTERIYLLQPFTAVALLRCLMNPMPPPVPAPHVLVPVRSTLVSVYRRRMRHREYRHHGTREVHQRNLGPAKWMSEG
ncbi:hypothetical protein F3Y22_tig00110548pilonHSYRG01006 [Hibiscus syriacus]|uniref:Uncharacterized protein n=1 Tax=Hibiscus syriacus TaxID=106335 RepID=A0A6A3ABZ1_HIBSY|nr:hypothetical protein F3Y22_tig00110548pilonHSYRG01006 [Hibiscus syriacus]